MGKFAQFQTTFGASRALPLARMDAERPAADALDEMWDAISQELPRRIWLGFSCRHEEVDGTAL